MARAIAVFDIDGTILRGKSAEEIFVRYLVSNRELSLSDLIRFIGKAVSGCGRGGLASLKGNKAYLAGKRIDLVEDLARDCFRKDIAPAILPRARDKIEEHRAAGREIVLLSGTVGPLLSSFKKELQADHAHGSELEISHGRITGRVMGLHPYGRNKNMIIRSNYAERYDLSISYAYADDRSDFDFLHLFGFPFIVNPDARLVRKAEKAGLSNLIYW